MKLLCDVCEKAVASVVCCADEAALCFPCDARVHAANKLAGKHQRVPLLSETSEPALCDICQERSSSFFCIEDRALLCRECDVSIHSANALAAKHKRFLLTGIRVGINSTISWSQETSPAVSEHMASPSNYSGSVKKLKHATLDIPNNESKPSPAVTRGKGKPSSSISKMATQSTSFMQHSNINKAMVTSKETLHPPLQSPSPLLKSIPRLSIQRLSSGHVPFIVPVLSTLNPSIAPATNMDLDVAKNSSVSDYVTTGIADWKLDELLTDLAGVCESGQAIPPKEDNIAPGFGEQEPPWYAELDFLEEQLSPSQEEGVAAVPEILPSPPTASGLVTSRGKQTCLTAHTWDFDYLFTGSDEVNDVPVVPDIDGRRSSPTNTITSNNKKRKNWLTHV